MKKKIIWWIMMCVLLTLSSCTREIKEKADTVADNLEGEVEIWTSEVSKDLVETYINKFREVHSKVNINNTYISESEFENKILTTLEFGERMPDIVIISEALIDKVSKYHSEFGELNEESGTLRNKNSYISVGSKAIAMPWYITPRAMFYRKDILERAQINPEDIKTWQDYIEAGEKILEYSEGKVKLLPLNTSRDSSFFRQLLNQLGSSYYDKEGNVRLTSEASIKSMTLLKSMYDSKIAYNAVTTAEIISAAQKNEIATIPYGTQIISEMRGKLKDQSGKWGIMNMPAFEPGGVIASAENSIYICIGKDLSHNKAAMELKLFLQNNKDLEKEFIVNKGIFPFMSRLYDDPFMDEADVYFNNEKIWRYLAEIIRETPEFHISGEFSKVKAAVTKAQEDIIINKDDINTVLTNADKQFNIVESENIGNEEP